MTVRFTTTSDTITHVKCLTYGESGIGKTTLCKTAPTPIIISAEKGLLSLSDVSIPVIEVETVDDLKEAYAFVTGSDDAGEFETVCLDSISDIAETLLHQFKEEAGKDPRQAYGRLNDEVMEILRNFRDIPGKHVYVTAKAKRLVEDQTGLVTWVPSLPGQQLGPALPYMFDFVIPLKMGRADKVDYRYLQTVADMQWIAKDRSGKLDFQEEPDLAKLFAKALNPDIERH